MFGKNGVDASLQIANAFAVDDSDLKNPALLARRKIVGNQRTDFFRFESVQIKNSIDWELNWIYIVRVIIHLALKENEKIIQKPASSSRKAGRSWSDASSFRR